eukprot:4223617-Pyramimonas_sp.AAC.1
MGTPAGVRKTRAARRAASRSVRRAPEVSDRGDFDPAAEHHPGAGGGGEAADRHRRLRSLADQLGAGNVVFVRFAQEQAETEEDLPGSIIGGRNADTSEAPRASVEAV